MKKITSFFFPPEFESVFAEYLTGKILSFDFYPKAVTLSAIFGFHGPRLLTFKTDRLDLRGLDLGKSDDLLTSLKFRKTLNNNDHTS